MKKTSHTVIAALGIVMLGAAFTSTATAGCGDLPGNFAAPSGAQPTPFQRAAYVRAFDSVSIVGLWQVMFVAKGNPASVGIPDGTVIDMGYATWHHDGTEIMNSGRDPATSSFCMGVWEQVGYFNYALNHVTLSWIPAGPNCMPATGNAGCFLGPGNIKEQITLDPSGKSYSGTFAITQFDTTGKNVLATIMGTIAAQRITAE